MARRRGGARPPRQADEPSQQLVRHLHPRPDDLLARDHGAAPSPLGEATLYALSVFDNLICVVFLFDFAINLLGSHPRSEYFVRQRGWLDLLGSFPSLGILRATALLRLARLSRLVRVARLLRGDNRRALVQDIIRNRGEYAIFITLLPRSW